ncbi:hypothetical protein [Stenotrophomonas sp. VV52]|uniref:hypothetical protein n=1 Tax=Stenotrophomonas sp. VV52 TaxID=2066958 RepID=UPI000C9E0425|nr:hypothetical protein [Stenotrophomonas sp. VV52]
MSDESGGRAAELRRVFASAPGEALTMQRVYERMGVVGIDQAVERKNIRSTMPCLVRGGFVVKSGLGPAATFKATGAGMRRPTATGEGRAARAVHDRSRAARVGLQAANTPQPINVAKVEPGETVEQFKARGGKVEILPTFWGQAAA